MEQGATGPRQPAIPEDVLVALAALDVCCPEWLRSRLAAETEPADLPQELRGKVSGPRILVHLPAYLEMSGGIRLS